MSVKHLLAGESAAVALALAAVPALAQKKYDPGASDASIAEWTAFMKKYYPDGSLIDNSNVYGYTAAKTMVQVLKHCGDNLTRENVMKQAASLKDFAPNTLLPGIKINTGPKDFATIESVQLMRFDGKSWVRFGEVIAADNQQGEAA